MTARAAWQHFVFLTGWLALLAVSQAATAQDNYEIQVYGSVTVAPGHHWYWVGDHIRPRIRVPESWHWPVGVSLSNEIGYQRREFFPRHLDVGDPADRGTVNSDAGT
jgi:hypothetical protein